MRILILNWRDVKNPLSGGAEEVTHEHAKAWVKAGHTVTFFTASFPGAKAEEYLDGVRIIRRGNNLLIHLFIFHLLVCFYYLKNFKGRIDLVVDQIHGIPFFTPLYVKEKKLAFIHEVAREIWDYLYPFPISFIGRNLERFYFRFYRETPFIAVSLSTKRDLIKMGIREDKITVIENGITCQPILKLEKKEAPPKVLFVNRLTPAKGIEDAIKAFAYINKEMSEVEFWIIGRSDEGYLKKLKSLANRLALGSKVSFFGFVSEGKKLEFLKSAYVLVHPSIREGWGLIVTEANAMGTPAVVYNSPGLIDSTRHLETGLVCEKNTPEELSENVLNLLQEPQLYEKLRKNAWEWSKTFTWEKAAKNSLMLLESL